MADAPPILDKDNIINVREGKSLYQVCIELRRRLAGVPGFEPYLDFMRQQELDGQDPVSSLWQCFRTGVPLLVIYNASQPESGPLRVKTTVPEKQAKEATFLFIKACMQQMNIPPAETFSVTELYNDNTTGFLKVTTLVNKVLDMLQLSGHLYGESDGSADGSEGNRGSQRPSKQLTRRDHIINELLDSERHYVHHLQNLMALRNQLEASGVLTGDAIHNIFLNLDNLLDFAQRFLIRIEQQNEMPEDEQNWGALFLKYKDPFRQYEPFISNQRKCEATVAKEWTKMQEAVKVLKSRLVEQMLDNQTILNGFLLKPFQRLTKYPLLLKDLAKQTASQELQQDILAAIGVIQDVLNQADQSIDRDAREDALEDLKERVDDWKGLNLAILGELLLTGTFPVAKDTSGGIRSKYDMSNEDKVYHMYLFTRILLLAKDVNVSKQKKKGLPAYSARGKPKMHIKGRIFFANVISANMSSIQGNYTMTISWKGEKGEDGTQTFVIKFKNDETLRKWHQALHMQRTTCLLEKGSKNVSSTTLTSLAGLTLNNPYADHEEDEDFSRMSSTTYGDAEFNMSRVGSSTSLRQRSTTASSGTSSNPHASIGRNGLPQLNTRIHSQSPGSYAHESYFSPVEENTPPQSARSSAQSTLTSTYRSMTPVGGQAERHPTENHYRNTAPAMGRDNPRGNPYLQNGRGRPSMPHNMVQSANNVNRMRSASSPDVHPQIQRDRKYTNGDHIPAVPSIPAYMSKQMALPGRNQTNSPNNAPSQRMGAPPQHSLNGHRPQLPGHGYTYDSASHQEPRRSGHQSTRSTDRVFSPVMPPPGGDVDFMPTQLRAKVRFDQNYVSMIIPSNISYRSLADRIDAKLNKFTNCSIAAGTVKLRYQDEEGEYVLIDCDDGVQDALADWRETHADKIRAGLQAELLLFAHSI